MRVYPAYARTIAAHVVRGQRPLLVAVVLSDDWRYCDHVPKVCLRPEEWAPGRWEFGYVRGLHVVVVFGTGASGAQLAELLCELMAAGPVEIWVWDIERGWLLATEITLELADWVRALVRPNPPPPRLEACRLAYHRAQLRAAEVEVEASRRASARDDVARAGEVLMHRARCRARVRELFGSADDSGAARAA